MTNRLLIEIARPFVRAFSKRCEKDNRYVIEAALHKYVDKNEKLCFSCNLKSKILNPFISRTASSMGISDKNLEWALKNKYIRDAVACAVEGVGDFGFLEPAVCLYLMVWNFTKLCNFKCPHCYENAGAAHPNELSIDEKYMVVDQFVEARGRHIAISGGEPTIHPDFKDVVKYIKSKNLLVSVASNGSRFCDERFTKEIAPYLTFVQLSLDSPFAEKHDEFRNFPGSFEMVRKAARNLNEYGVNVAYAYFVSKSSLPDIPGMIELAKIDGVDLVLYDYKCVGRARDMVSEDPTPKEREKLYDYLCSFVKGKQKKEKPMVYVIHPRYGVKTIEHDVPQFQASHFTPYEIPEGFGKAKMIGSFIGGCGAGTKKIDLEPDGTLIVCVNMPIPLGNVRETTIKEVWKSSPTLWKLRDRNNLKGTCRECEYVKSCGGCRAEAFGYTGDYLESDPSCILVNPSGNYKNLEKTLFE
ncbi:MAG: radical SAM protein [Candidatus Aenigmarchaeota archaeon]|nr:radical SAM protein [Candidatus Aenigmarchaeota archaeon]